MDIITLDFETYFDNAYSLSKMTTIEYVRSELFLVHMVGIKINDQPTKVLVGDAVVSWFNAHRSLLNASIVVCHNAQFDGTILSEIYGVEPYLLLCTMSMAYGAYGPNLPSYSLNMLAKTLLDDGKIEGVLESSKGLVTLPAETKLKMIEYCRQDVDVTYKLFNHLKRLLPPHEFRLIDLTMKMYTRPIFEINLPLLEDFLLQYEDYQRDLLSRAGVELTELRSDLKFADCLRLLGVEPDTKITATGRESFAFAKTDAFMDYLSNHPNPDVAGLASARLGLRSSIEQTRVATFVSIGATGSLPVPLMYCGAHTGRWAARTGEALNLQNLPKRSRLVDGVHPLRLSLCAPAGYSIVVADSAQIEARVIAALADERWLVDAFRDDRDVYSEFAGHLLNCSVSRDTPTERYIGKVAVLGLGYGMGFAAFASTLHSGAMGPSLVFDETFMEQTDAHYDQIQGSRWKVERARGTQPRTMSWDDWLTHCAVCDWVVGVYRGTNSNIAALWKRIEQYALVLTGETEGPVTADFGGIELVFAKETIHLPSGRKLRYPKIRYEGQQLVYDTSYTLRPAKKYAHGGSLAENITQAVARDVVALQMLELSKSYPILGMVHDEVIMLAPTDAAQQACDDALRVMRTPPKWARMIPLDAEASFGANYGACK